jgi:transcriptional regulator with XRE-family HTH domain
MQGRDHTAIGKRGQARRRLLELSVADVAARMGVTRDRVYNLECYGAGTIALVEQWALALEWDPRDLAFGPLPDCERSERRSYDDRITTRRLGA